jgi:hypothetical protein
VSGEWPLIDKLTVAIKPVAMSESVGRIVAHDRYAAASDDRLILNQECRHAPALSFDAQPEPIQSGIVELHGILDNRHTLMSIGIPLASGATLYAFGAKVRTVTRRGTTDWQ